jgi:hypothetical protein
VTHDALSGAHLRRIRSLWFARAAARDQRRKDEQDRPQAPRHELGG